MRVLLKAYDGLIVGLAALAGATLAFVTLSIVVDVTLRNLGFRPMQWTSAVVEYALLFVTMAGSPWLARRGGHIAINSFVEQLPARARARVGRAVLLVSVTVLAVLSWRAGVLAWHEYARGSVDIRSINIPGYVAPGLLGAGFALLACEFLRLLLVGATMAGGRHGD